MLSSLSLNGMWKARGFDGVHGTPEDYCSCEVDERSFIDALVPGEVHLDLERAGWIQDCNVGFNALSARWVEEQVWVYRTYFDIAKDSVSGRAWLVFEGLDLNARIYLNGEAIGGHDNAFTPCRLDVSDKLVDGRNVVAVRIECGLYSTSEKPGLEYNHMMLDHMLHKRSWLRKPQYQFSWDWNPRLINIGIWRGVRLEWTDSVRIDAVTVYPALEEDHSSATLHTKVFLETASSETTSAVIRVRVAEENLVSEIGVELTPGISEHCVSIDVANPKLWWPRTHGKQHLYGVHVEVLVGDRVVDKTARRTGIRSIQISEDPHPVEGKYFILEINGQPIFAKGGNWVPPDLIGARVDSETYKKLVDMAADANFNTLRIWGGGFYADHHLMDACDELGIVVWHDFVFACSKYPGDDPEFLQNVRREVTHVVRDLSHHPSLVVWCGNNELEWLNCDWEDDKYKSNPDHALYHLEIPRIIKREDPSRAYRVSSPYSGDSIHPNDPTVGDQHPWNVTILEDGTNYWAYRSDVSRDVFDLRCSRPNCVKVFRFEYSDGELVALRNSSNKVREVEVASKRDISRWCPDSGDTVHCGSSFIGNIRPFATLYISLSEKPLSVQIDARSRAVTLDAQWTVTTDRPNTARISKIQFLHDHIGWIDAIDASIFKDTAGRSPIGIPPDFRGFTQVKARGVFHCASVPSELGILYERDHLNGVCVNGVSVDLSASSRLPVWDDSCRLVDISPLVHPGDNEVELDLTYQEFETSAVNDAFLADWCMPSCDAFLAGTFKLVDGFLRDDRRDTAQLPIDLSESGWSEYDGVLRLEASVKVTSELANSVLGVMVDLFRDDCVELILDGISIGRRVTYPYEFVFPSMHPGTHVICIRMTSTSANLFGNPGDWGVKSVSWMAREDPTK